MITVPLFPHIFLIGLGGGLGAMMRFAISHNLQNTPFDGTTFPYGTFCVNILGCLLIGLAAAYFDSHSDTSLPLKLFLIIGILGGFTTFSTFSMESLSLLQHGHPALAWMYIIGSPAIGITASLGAYTALKSTG